MDPLTIFILFGIGIVAGGLGGLLGIGGCVLMMPTVRFGFAFSPAMAVGTTLTAVVFTAGAGAIKHARLGNVDRPATKVIAVSGVIGVLVGSAVFAAIASYDRIVDLVVGIAFLYPAVRMFWEGVWKWKAPEPKEAFVGGSPAAKGVTGGLVGFLTGIIGLGGGYVMVPSMVYVLKAPMKIAIGTSLASFVWFALVGALIKLYEGFVNVPAAVAMGLGAALGAVLGAILMTKVKTAALKVLFGAVFLYVGLKYLFIVFGVQI
jgi:hypothetical protein